MNYFNQYQDSISTVQLSPFGEEEWNRIVTYAPIYVHWTDMMMMPGRRTNKTTGTKLNTMNQIDLNALKLEDEILLNELCQMRRVAAIAARQNAKNHTSAVLVEEQDQHTTSSDSFHEEKELVKHNCSYVEPSFTQQPNNNKRSIATNQLQFTPLNSFNPTGKVPGLSLGLKPQPSLGVQLRQSAIAREQALSATHDRHLPTPLSMASSKRTISSAHSNQYQNPPQQQRRILQSRLSNEMHSMSSNDRETLTRSSTSLSGRKTHTKTTNSSRTTMHMLKTKNDRTRQKQNVELRTVLVEPWKQPLYTDGILDEAIPNSLEIMYQICGPATPFERNLRQNFHRQLGQFRTGSIHH